MNVKSINVDFLRRAVVTVALLTVIPALAILYMMAAHFNGLIEQKALHYAQVARNVVFGKGFTTSVITPFGLQNNPALENHPDLWCAPVYVFWQSLAYRAIWPSDRVSAAASSGAWLLLLWSVFIVAQRRYGTRPAWMAFLIVLLNPYMLDAAVSGLPHALAGLLMLWFFDRLVPPLSEHLRVASPGNKIPWRRVVFSSLLGAVAMLTNYDLIPATLMCLVLYWSFWPSRAGFNKPLLYPDEVNLPGDRMRTWFEQRVAPRIVFVVLVAVMIATSPWCIRNIVVGGHPLYSLHAVELLTNTISYPGQSVFRLFNEFIPPAFVFAIANAYEVAAKAAGSITAGALAILNQMNVALLALIVVGTLRASNDQHHVRLIRYWLLGTGLFLLSIAIHDGDFGALAVVLPVLAVLAAGELFLWKGTVLDPAAPVPPRGTEPGLASRLHVRSPRRLTALLVVVFVFVQWGVKRESRMAEARLERSVNVPWLAQRTATNEVVLSASPWTLAWQGNVHSVWMPEDQISLRNMLRIHGASIPWLYFPRQRPLPPSDDPVPAVWFDLIRNPDSAPGYVEVPSLSRREALRQRITEVAP